MSGSSTPPTGPKNAGDVTTESAAMTSDANLEQLGRGARITLLTASALIAATIAARRLTLCASGNVGAGFRSVTLPLVFMFPGALALVVGAAQHLRAALAILVQIASSPCFLRGVVREERNRSIASDASQRKMAPARHSRGGFAAWRA